MRGGCACGQEVALALALENERGGGRKKHQSASRKAEAAKRCGGNGGGWQWVAAAVVIVVDMDTHLGHHEKTTKRELLITGANMTDEEWGAFCKQRHKKVDDRGQPPTKAGSRSTGKELEEGSAENKN